LGRIEEAREAVRNVLAANPNETLATMRAYLQTSFQDAASLDAYLEGLRRAGLPAA